MKVTIAQIGITMNILISKYSVILALIFVFFYLNNPIYSQQINHPEKFSEEKLEANFDKFILGIDSLRITKKYPEIARKILSQQPRQQKIALNMLGGSQEIEAIPWILLLLNSDDKSMRFSAGSCLGSVLYSLSIIRRNNQIGRYVVLKPLKKQDVDLRPLAWIVLKLLRTDDPNLIAYGITMARYLNLYEFEDEIVRHKDSIHPAVTNTMKWAIEELKLQKEYESGKLKQEK